MDKKKIFAVAIFFLMGFFVFTFANPAEDTKKATKGKSTKDETTNVEERIENTNDDNALANLPVVAQVIPANDALPVVPANVQVEDTDTTKPVIELIGGDVILRLGETYNELGATATDDVDGNLTNSIVISGEVGEAKGTYTITYNVTDSSNNKANEVTRTVYVVDPTELEEALENANEILNNNNENEEVANLIEKLEEAITNGNNVLEDETSKQEDIDNAADEINKILDEINNLEFNVKFVDWNDSTIKELKVKYGESATAPEDPTRFGFDFIKWNGTYTNVTNNQTVKAEYSLNTYSIEYEDSLNAVNNNVTKYNVTKIELINDLYKLGYTFGGFTYKGKTVKSTEGYAENLKLLANWTIDNYTIKLDPANGTTLEDIKYTILDTVVLPEPSKKGYKFLGWFEGENKVESVVTGNYELVAKYELIDYTITYNDELEAENNNDTSYNVENNVTISDLVKLGYTFNGWFKGNTKVSSTEGYAENLELTADWTLETYKIDYVYEGTLEKENIKEYNVNTVFTLNNPKKDNYNFIGWFNGDVKVEKIENMTGNLTLTAVYQAKQTGIRADYKTNTFLQFNKSPNVNVNVKDYINVFPVYADGTEGEALAQSEYEISGFSTANATQKATLTVKQNNTNYTDTLDYSVVSSNAFQTKFEVKAPGKNYRETKSSLCGSNCDSKEKTKSVGVKENVLEIIEHYDQYIKVNSVVVNGNLALTIKKDGWGDNDAVRWSDQWWGDIYNPVYIASNGNLDKKSIKPLDYNSIQTVTINYTRTFEGFWYDTYKTYVVIFAKVGNDFVAIDEYQV